MAGKRKLSPTMQAVNDAVQAAIHEAVKYEREQCTNREQRIAKKSIGENREELTRLQEFKEAHESGELERLRARVEELELVLRQAGAFEVAVEDVPYKELESE